MPAAKKHKLKEVINFGEALIGTGDLDPVYIALTSAATDGKAMRTNVPFGKPDQMYRLLLAYFCFYHLGVSAFISEQEGETFWEVMEIAARNKLCWPSEINPDLKFDSWPRGTERRHFRGDKCVKAIREMRKFSGGKPDHGAECIVKLWQELANHLPFEKFFESVTSFPLMGPWIAFKVADVMERVLRADLQFPSSILTFYKEPRAALDLIAGKPEDNAEKLLLHFQEKLAPPYYYSPRPRKCNIQEIETVLCKFKAYTNGTYWVGKDIHEIRKGLKGWGRTADMLLSWMPREVRQGLFV